VSATRKLRIERILLEAFLVPWRRRRVFVKGLTFPGAAVVALQCAFWYFSPDPEWASWLAWGARAILWIIFAVICHRLVLLDPREGDVAIVPQWTWRETRFLGWCIAVYGLVSVITWVAMMAIALILGSMLSTLNIADLVLAVGIPPAGALAWMLRYATWWLYGEEPTLLAVALVSAVGTILIAIEIAALSLAYRELSSTPVAPDVIKA
jgi:hypothetical protein